MNKILLGTFNTAKEETRFPFGVGLFSRLFKLLSDLA
jgi:hypothetical protein